ncbi:unnamed protein product, partial [Closterium sp. NIES-53]
TDFFLGPPQRCPTSRPAGSCAVPSDPRAAPAALRAALFDMWLDDLQLYLLSDSRDSVSLFDHTSGDTPAPPGTADSATRSQWLTRDAAACLAIRNHLPLAECAHFGQNRTAQALYNAVVARYSSPATAALGRLLLPYLFPELSTFATVEDLVSHLRTSDARYRAALPAEFLARNPPPMYITLYFIVTRLPDSLRSVRDHFLALNPTALTVDLLEQHFLAAGCSPSPLAPSYASAAAVDVLGAEDVGATSTSGKRRRSKGKGGRGGGGGSGGGGGGSSGGGGGSGGGGSSGSGGGSGGFGGSGGGSGGGGGSGSSGSGGGSDGAAQRGGSGGGQRHGGCPYVIRMGDRAGQTCGKPHTQHRCFFRLDNAWRAEFGDEVERPRWAELLKSQVAIFDLDFDAILAAMYALSVSAEGDSYLCVPPDPGIEAAALGASESALSGTAPAEALHTFTLDAGASRCLFRESTTLTPLSAPAPVRLADPSRGLVVARSSTVLPCPAVPSGSLSGLHLPSFSTNLVSTASLQDATVTTTTLGGQRVSICTCTRTGRHLATFTRRPGSSMYTQATKPPQVAASAQVSTSGQVAPPCSCRLLSHQTLLWHHRLGHPSLPRLRGMHSRLLVSGLPKSLPPLMPLPALPCLPCIEGRQRAAPHSSSFPPTTAPLQTLHMDVWGLARVTGQGRKRYFLLVVDDYTRYTTVFPLRTKGERFRADLPVLRLHSDRGGEFSSDLLRDFCRGEGILQSFTLPASLQQNGIAECRIGLVMEVARTSMIHAAAPHFQWPFAVQYAAHQLNLWPRVSLPETSPTLCWTRKVGDASVFRVWGSRAFVRDTSADKLSARAIPCDVTFDESVPFYRLFPYRSAPLPPPPLFLAPGPPPLDPLLPQGPAPLGVSQVDPLPGTVPLEVAIGLGAARGTASRGAASGGAEPGGVEPGGAEPGGAEPGGVEPAGVESGGAEPAGSEPRGVESGGAEPRVTAGAGGTGGAGAASPGGAAAASPRGARTRGTRADGTSSVGGAGAGDPTEPGGAGAGGTGAGGVGAGGTRDGGAGAVDPGAGGAGGTVRPRPYFVPLLQQPASSLPAPSPYTEQTGGLIERRELASRPASLVRIGRRVPRPCPPSVPDTHAMALRPSSVPMRVPLPPPPESSLLAVSDPESDRARGASPTVSRLLATVVTDPSIESTAASALVAELLEFAAALVAESESASPPSVGGECALGTDVVEDRQDDFECLAAAVPRFASMLLASEGDPDAPDIPTPRSYAEAITGPYSSQWQASMDAEMASWKSTGTYVDAVPPSRANIGDGMWIFRRDYKLHSLDFSTAFLRSSLHEEICLRRPPGFTRSFPAALGFTPSADPSLFLRTDTSLPPFYVLLYIDDLVFATADTETLKLQKRHTCTDLGPSALRLLVLLATAHSSVYQPLALSSTFGRGYTFSLGSGSVSWRSTCSSSVLSSSCEAEIYAGAMAAQELRWLTYQLTDLGEQPRSPPQRGQLRLAYVATRANTADIFTKALPPAPPPVGPAGAEPLTVSPPLDALVSPEPPPPPPPPPMPPPFPLSYLPYPWTAHPRWIRPQSPKEETQ